MSPRNVLCNSEKGAKTLIIASLIHHNLEDSTSSEKRCYILLSNDMLEYGKVIAD
jgi:hypothetical protein